MGAPSTAPSTSPAPGGHEDRTRRRWSDSRHGRARICDVRVGKPAISSWRRTVVLSTADCCRRRSTAARLRPRRAAHSVRRCSNPAALQFGLSVRRSGRSGDCRPSAHGLRHVHATGTQRVFFFRARKSKPTAPFQITSTVAPTLAERLLRTSPLVPVAPTLAVAKMRHQEGRGVKLAKTE